MELLWHLNLIILLWAVDTALGERLSTTMECCSDETVYKCTESFFPGVTGLHASFPAQKRFALVTYATDDIMGYARWSYAVQYAFAEWHNLPLYRRSPKSGHNFEPRDERWNKIKLVRDLMDEEAVEEGSFVVWMDADLIYLDLDWKLEDIVARHPGYDLIISRDSAPESGLVNTGLMIFRVSKWSRDFLDMWWESHDRALHSEQGVFSLLSRNFSEESVRRMAILEPSILNSVFDAWEHQEDHHSILHLAGAHSVLRASLFRFGFETICKNIEERGSQLNLLVPMDEWLGGSAFRQVAGVDEWNEHPPPSDEVVDGHCILNPVPRDTPRCHQLGLSRSRQQEMRRYIARYLIAACDFEIRRREGHSWTQTNIRSLRSALQTSIQLGFGLCPDHDATACETQDFGMLISKLVWVFDKLFEMYLEFNETSATMHLTLVQDCVDAGFELLERYHTKHYRERKYILLRLEPLVMHSSIFMHRADNDGQSGDDHHLYYIIKFLDLKAGLAADTHDVDSQLLALEKAEEVWLMLLRETADGRPMDYVDPSGGSAVVRKSSFREQQYEEMGQLLCHTAQILCFEKRAFGQGLEKAHEGLRRILHVWGPDTGRTQPPGVTQLLSSCRQVASRCSLSATPFAADNDS